MCFSEMSAHCAAYLPPVRNNPTQKGVAAKSGEKYEKIKKSVVRSFLDLLW
jgi:hypothetical protein